MSHSTQACLCLFAASKDQQRYFERLSHHLSRDMSTTKLWYKDLPKTPSAPLTNADELVAPIVDQWLRRKRSTSVGQRKASWWWRLAERWQYWQAVRLLRQYTGMLSKSDCSHVCVWNGKKFRQALFVKAANQVGKPVLFFETGPLPGYSMVDRVGVNAFSSIPKSVEFYEARSIQHHFLAQSVTPQQVIQQVFIPFQVVEDSNIYLHSPWIQNMRHLFYEVKSLAVAHPKIDFVFKQHPFCSETYDDLVLDCLPNMRFENTLSSVVLIAQSQLVITINSTVGMETLIQHKPLIVLGDALYDFFPLTRPAQDTQSLCMAFEAIVQGWLPPVGLVESFVDYLKQDYAVIGDAMKNPDTAHLDAMTAKVLSLL